MSPSMIGTRWRPKDRRKRWTLTVVRDFAGYTTTKTSIVYMRDGEGTAGLGIAPIDMFLKLFVPLEPTP